MRFQFCSKAQTLQSLKPVIQTGLIPKFKIIQLHQWDECQTEVIEQIQKCFPGKKIAIRSSLSTEDQKEASEAGKFESILNVDSNSPIEISNAIKKVITSYGVLPKTHPHEEILIQEMVKDIAVTGVITSQGLDSGSPYYFFNYDDLSGRTDSITGGSTTSKTVIIHRKTSRQMIESERLAKWLELCRELEFICQPQPLDIEFAQNLDGQLFLLQVRPIATQKNWDQNLNSILNEKQAQLEDWWNGLEQFTIFGNMPDWNPAEILGVYPGRLAISLYRKFITRWAWSKARSELGYQHPSENELMIVLHGYPYIDVRKSFESFIPHGVSQNLSQKITAFWLKKLKTHPEFHDKIEFNIASTLLDFGFHSKNRSDHFTKEEIKQWSTALLELNQKNIDITDNGPLFQSLSKVNQLNEFDFEFNYKNPLQWEKSIQKVIHYGTIPFSKIARLAFMAESFLLSAVETGLMKSHRVQEFKASLETITHDFSLNFQNASQSDEQKRKFYQNFGHLRPSTYDIESLRYDQRNFDFRQNQTQRMQLEKQFEWTEKEIQAFSEPLKRVGLKDLDFTEFSKFLKTSIEAREKSKLIFTRHISSLLECIARWGEMHQFNREDLSHLSIDEILQSSINTDYHPIKLKKEMPQRKRERTNLANLKMPYLIRSLNDLYVIPLHRNSPNFITLKTKTASVVELTPQSHNQSLNGKIIAIQSADPGFDWIFTHDIAGLVTQFGGCNSHMAIRCAEFQLPAAIGCGEVLYRQAVKSKQVTIDPISQKLRFENV